MKMAKLKLAKIATLSKTKIALEKILWKPLLPSFFLSLFFFSPHLDEHELAYTDLRTIVMNEYAWLIIGTQKITSIVIANNINVMLMRRKLTRMGRWTFNQKEKVHDWNSSLTILYSDFYYKIQIENELSILKYCLLN